MKSFKLFLTAFLGIFISMQTIAQKDIQKKNSYYHRTELFDSYANLVGYAKENPELNNIEYFDVYGNMIKRQKQKKIFNKNKRKKTDYQDVKKKKTHKRGDLCQRHEVFDLSGNIKGYYEFNSIFNRWEYNEAWY